MNLPNRRQAFAICCALGYIVALATYGRTAHSEDRQWQDARQQRIVESPVVYITPSGAKYHRPTHYRDRNIGISLYEAKEQNYGACRVCRPHGDVELLAPLSWYWASWKWKLAFLALPLLGIHAIFKRLGDEPLPASQPHLSKPY